MNVCKGEKANVQGRMDYTNSGVILYQLGLLAQNGKYPFMRILTDDGKKVYGEFDAAAFGCIAENGLPNAIPLIPKKSTCREFPTSIELGKAIMLSIYSS